MSIPAKMILLTAPSGAGKTTLAAELIRIFPFLEFSISATTRKARDYEIDGIHYYFYSQKEFDGLIQNGQLAEYEEVYPGQFYGTLKSEVTRIWDKGLIVLFDVDVKGARNLKRTYGDLCLSLFIKPPSMEELEKRLINRRTEDGSSLQKRLSRVRYEMQYENEFDHTIVNDKLEDATVIAKKVILNYLGL